MEINPSLCQISWRYKDTEIFKCIYTNDDIRTKQGVKKKMAMAISDIFRTEIFFRDEERTWKV